jgi:hypothetical protein
MPRPDRRNKINRKAPNVKRINERDNPFTDRCTVIMVSVAEDAESDREADFDEDEG